jgi:hypothetical protein
LLEKPEDLNLKKKDKSEALQKMEFIPFKDADLEQKLSDRSIPQSPKSA